MSRTAQQFFEWGIREKCLVENLKPFFSKKNKLIDIGCGDGHFIYRLWKDNTSRTLFGLDFSFEKLKKLKKECPFLNLILGRIEHLPIKTNSFEVVLCSEVLEHILRYQQALLELKRITIKNLIITTPNDQEPIKVQCPNCQTIHFLSGHINSFNKKKWRRLSQFLESRIEKFYGFKTIYSYNSLTLRFPRLIRRLLDRVLILCAPILKFTKANYLLVNLKIKK